MARKHHAETLDPLHDPAGAVSYIAAGSTRTLERWRATGHGPDFIKVGHLVRYRQSALDRWLRRRTRRHTRARSRRRNQEQA